MKYIYLFKFVVGVGIACYDVMYDNKFYMFWCFYAIFAIVQYAIDEIKDQIDNLIKAQLAANQPKAINKPFQIIFEDRWYKPGDMIVTNDGTIAIVQSEPKRKWYKLILQILTIGIYRAPFEYPIAVDIETNKL